MFKSLIELNNSKFTGVYNYAFITTNKTERVSLSLPLHIGKNHE